MRTNGMGEVTRCVILGMPNFCTLRFTGERGFDPQKDNLSMAGWNHSLQRFRRSQTLGLRKPRESTRGPSIYHHCGVAIPLNSSMTSVLTSHHSKLPYVARNRR